jgi:hypothetical protein
MIFVTGAGMLHVPHYYHHWKANENQPETDEGRFMLQVSVGTQKLAFTLQLKLLTQHKFDTTNLLNNVQSINAFILDMIFIKKR